MNIKLLYDNTKWIETEVIKAVNVIKEFDISGISVSTTTIDITISCEQFTDLSFILYKPCDVYDGTNLMFNMYVLESTRNGDFEWKLSLTGMLGYLSQIMYHGDVYSDPNDYLNKPYYGSLTHEIFDPEYSYVPSITNIKEILTDIKKDTDIEIETDSSLESTLTKTLHKVGLYVMPLDMALLNINFLLGTFIDDKFNKITFKLKSNISKNIPEENILNDARISYNELYDINIITYAYECLRHGAIMFKQSVSLENAYVQNTGDKVGGYSYSYSGAYWCDLAASGGGMQVRDTKSNTIEIPAKEINSYEYTYSVPVSSINVYITQDGWEKRMGTKPMHPNYSPKEEALQDNAVKYSIQEYHNELKIDNSITGEAVKIENTLLGPDWYETIKDRIKKDFSYTTKLSLKIVERPDNFAKYSEAKYGKVRYGVNTGDTTYDIGDKVNCTIRGKTYEGYITRMAYNLNGNVIIKDCEITCNRSDK